MHNSRYKTGKIEYVKDAAVSADFATATSSDDMGQFQLRFRGMPTGTKVDVFLEKYGLEVVNDRDLKNVILGMRDKLGNILGKKGRPGPGPN